MAKANTPKPEEPEVTTDPVLSITLQAVPGIPIEIDGTEYHVFTSEHLSIDKEDVVRALVQRESIYSRMADRTDPDDMEEHVELARKTRLIRGDLIKEMTDIPKKIIGELRTTQQGQIVDIIGQGIR